MGAKYHSNNNIMGMVETHNLDNGYWNNHLDSEIFKYYIKKTTDSDRKDNYLWRWEVTNDRAKVYKNKITSAFTQAFR